MTGPKDTWRFTTPDGTDQQAQAQPLLTTWIQLAGVCLRCYCLIVAEGIPDGHTAPTAEILPDSADALNLCPRAQSPPARGLGLSSPGCTWPPRGVRTAQAGSGCPPRGLPKPAWTSHYKALESPAFYLSPKAVPKTSQDRKRNKTNKPTLPGRERPNTPAHAFLYSR